MTTIKVGIAGLGYWGPNLARNFAGLGGCDVAWLCDADPDALERVGRSIPSARPTADLGDLLGDPELDAIVLATPVPTHAELAVRVLEAGKHCFVEKPLAQDVESAERAVAAADAAGRILMVGHLLEYHPAVAKLKEIAGQRRARRHPLHLLQPPQPREAARGRERAVVARRARRVRAAPPRRRGAVRDRGARRVLHAPGDRGRGLRLPAFPVRPGRASAPLVARPAQGAPLHDRRRPPDGDVRRHGPGAQGHDLRQGLRPARRLVGRVHHALRGHPQPARSRTASRCGSSASTS